MKKSVFLLLLLCCFTYATPHPKEDPIVMTIAGKDVPLSEFLFISKKDKQVDLTNMQSLKEYAELFKTFKLKVADAEAAGMDQTAAFEDEYNEYIKQLRASFMSDKKGEEEFARLIYDRGATLLNISNIMVKLPPNAVAKDTVEVYKKAMDIYNKIKSGESFDQVGKQLLEENENDAYYYGHIDYLAPLQISKVIENVAYSLNEGEISTPIRSDVGYHIVRLNKRIADQGKIKVAHILIAPFEDEHQQVADTTLLREANEIYQRAIDGESFALLAEKHSADVMTGQHGGELPIFGLGKMVEPFEKAAFALTTIGEISQPVKSRYGYHLIKLLEKRERPSFHEMERTLNSSLGQGEWNFELYDSFDQREKKKFNYSLNQEAYDELLRLCDDYFPTDTAFYNRASKMDKTLMTMKGEEFPQYEFAEYLRVYPFSTKNFSIDFFEDVYRLFVRDIYKSIEKETLETNNPEYPFLMKEYHDGILLFNISSERVWNSPQEEQEQLEAEWVKELNKKYESKINWPVLKKLNKDLKKMKDQENHR